MPGIVVTNTTYIKGVTLGSNQYLVNFNDDHNVVFASTCTFNSSSCSDAPIFAQDKFRSNDVSMMLQEENVSLFWNGYTGNTDMYYGEVSIEGYRKGMDFYEANEITQDLYLWDTEARSGIIGLGPNSPFWNQFVDEQSNAMYTISTARPYTGEDNEITIGFANLNQNTTNLTALQMNATQASTQYAMTNLSFG